ncbi:MAG: hypothetical protein LBH00_08615 [Planctomycetaceae bacterium]|nr:hypothetical protein [Planctomycetaceae bacterium]
MSVPENSPAPPSDTANTSKTRSNTELTAYVFSWRWLLGGFFAFVILAGLVGLRYVSANAGFVDNMSVIVDGLIEKADADWKAAENIKDPKEHNDLREQSLKTRGEAANLLQQYLVQQDRLTNPDKPNVVKVLEKLYGILEGLYRDSGECQTAAGIERGKQLLATAASLRDRVGAEESMKYRIRRLQLEWDRRVVPGLLGNRQSIITASVELLAFKQGISPGSEKSDIVERLKKDKDSYTAVRYAAITLFGTLAIEKYPPERIALPAAWFPQYPQKMDALFENLHQAHPEDVEIADAYARFLVGIDFPNLPYKDSAGIETVQRTKADGTEETPAESRNRRVSYARTIIDKMVADEANKSNEEAFFVRYEFNRLVEAADIRLAQAAGQRAEIKRPNRLDPDIEKILKLDPNNLRALLAAGDESLRCVEYYAKANQDIIAKKEKTEKDKEMAGQNTKQMELWDKQAGDFYQQALKHHPKHGITYQKLGDYYASRRQSEDAAKVWETGLKETNIGDGNILLYARLALQLLTLKKLDDAKKHIDQLVYAISDLQKIQRGEYEASPISAAMKIQDLLRALYASAEINAVAEKIDEAQKANRLAESKSLQEGFLKRRQDTLNLYRRAGLPRVADNPGDGMKQFTAGLVRDGLDDQFVATLLKHALFRAGGLAITLNEWGTAAGYYAAIASLAYTPENERAAACLLAADAYRKEKNFDQATNILAWARRAYPNNPGIQLAYIESLFSSELGKITSDSAVLNTIQAELNNFKEKYRKIVPDPWRVDIREIHLKLLRANAQNKGEEYLQARNAVLREFKSLESAQFPAAADGKIRNYIDEPAFVMELVGIYSSLAARTEFESLAPKLREFPDGAAAYYQVMYSDCMRRQDREGAISFIREAVADKQLKASQQEQFAALLQNLENREDNPAVVQEKIYNALKTRFDDSPDSLNPDGFLMLANMNVDRENFLESVEIRDRLKEIDPEGARWRYITVRIMLALNINNSDPALDNPNHKAVLAKNPGFNREFGDAPNFKKMRELQQVIQEKWADQDRTYLLKASIEERSVVAEKIDLTNKEDQSSRMYRDLLIETYDTAIRKGCKQTAVWARLADLYKIKGDQIGYEKLMSQATSDGIGLEVPAGQFPPPYGRMVLDVVAALDKKDGGAADEIARQCVLLAKQNLKDDPALFRGLHFVLGKTFFDRDMFQSAERHLKVIAENGGADIYPFALCLAKSGRVDEGFSVLLNEIEANPYAAVDLVQRLLLLQAVLNADGKKPSEAVYTRMDRLMTRIENGENLALRGKINDSFIPVGSEWVPTRKVKSLILRLPNNQGTFTPADIQFKTAGGLASGAGDRKETEPPKMPAKPEPPAPSNSGSK